jgi:hypothetical protein
MPCDLLLVSVMRYPRWIWIDDKDSTDYVDFVGGSRLAQLLLWKKVFDLISTNSGFAIIHKNMCQQICTVRRFQSS